MYHVIREVHFSYGHRLVNHPGKCARLHGHNARVRIQVSSEHLDTRGMVVDFDEIRTTIGAWISETLDHRMILAADDPAREALEQSGEELVIVDQPPTAEYLAAWIYREARRLRLPVYQVTLWETAGSCAVYHE